MLIKRYRESRTKEDVGAYLSGIFSNSKGTEWNNFEGVLETLVELEGQGFLISSKDSRFSSPVPVILQSRLHELSKSYTEKVEAIAKLIVSPEGVVKFGDSFSHSRTIMISANARHYFSKSKKLPIQRIDDFIYEHGVLGNLSQAKLSPKFFDTAAQNCNLIERNFNKAVASYKGIKMGLFK